MTRRRSYAAPPTAASPPATAVPVLRSVTVAVVTAALVLQILLPSLLLSRPAVALPLAADDASAIGVCFGAGRPSNPSAAPSGSGDGTVPVPGDHHVCCVLCSTPGLAAGGAHAAVDAGPAWFRIATALPRQRVPVIANASERTPVRPRAPPLA